MGKTANFFVSKTFTLFFLISFLLLSFSPAFLFQPAYAATLSSGSESISDSRPSTTAVSYTTTFSGVTLSLTKCIKLVFSDAATAGAVPTGMTTTGAALSGTSTYMPTPAGWTGTFTTNGTVTLTNATGETPALATGRTVVLTGITNGSTAGTKYFVQFSTYGATDCATSAIDSGTITFIYTAGQAVSLTVDPSIAFTVAGVANALLVNGATTTVTSTATTIPLGTVTTSANAIAAQDLTVTTNAGSGYTVYARYTAAPTSGANTIAAWTGTNAAPTAFSAAGTAAFGYTTNDATLATGTVNRFTSVGNVWAGFTTANLEVAYGAAAVASDVTRVGYQVGIAGTTPAGSYSTTVILTATPTY